MDRNFINPLNLILFNKNRKLFFNDTKRIFFLKEDDAFASGSERICYILAIHEKIYCIKITYRGNRKNKQNEKEYSYYSFLKNSGVDTSRLLNCHGWLNTNKGKGLLFDLVVDFCGGVASTLESYLDRYGIDKKLENELILLKNYIIKNNIIVCDLKEKNILVQWVSKEEFTLRVIDGVGNKDLFKIASYWKFIGRKKIIRHWDRFYKRIENNYSDRNIESR